MKRSYNPFQDVDRIKKRMVEPEMAGSVLKQALRNTGLDQKLLRYTFVSRWEDIVGGPMASRTRPEVIRDGVLVVRVNDSTWAQELSFYKKALLKRLGRYVPEDVSITDIHFYVAGNRGQYF